MRILIILLLLSIGIFDNVNAQFNSKSEALELLKNSNIWVDGMPNYSLNNKNGVLTISFRLKEATQYVVFDLKDPNFTVNESNGKTKVLISCKDSTNCLQTSLSTMKGTATLNKFELIMHSSFDNGKDKIYEEKYNLYSLQIAKALIYLQMFYK